MASAQRNFFRLALFEVLDGLLSNCLRRGSPALMQQPEDIYSRMIDLPLM